MKKYIPNIITIIRIFLAVSFPIIFLLGYEKTAIIIFAVAAFTDSIDGFLARRWKVVSDLGSRLDVIADKWLSVGAITILILKVSDYAILLAIGEILIIFAGLYKLKVKEEQKVVFLGKVKTVFLSFTILLMLINKIVINVETVVIIFTIITMILQIIDAGIYFFRKGAKNEK